jgi:hypothetical protein
VYFEAAAVIVTLVLLGQVLELRARGATGARSARCSTWPEDRAPDRGRRLGARRRRSRTSPSATGCACGRARSAGRRRRARRREPRRRVDDDRRADPGAKQAGDRVDRRHDQRHRDRS